MNYLQFREQWLKVGCFNIYQLRAWDAGFDRSNITRWVKNGYLCHLRQDWYAFRELLAEVDMSRFIACKIYSPSYISLHTALASYGIIPEAVTDITCVSTGRTTNYTNDFGRYEYRTVKPDFFFGYKAVPLARGGSYLMAEPEKAIVDLLYLNPQYDTNDELSELRIDEWWMAEECDVDRLRRHAAQTAVRTLQKRVDKLIKLYGNG